MSRHFGHEQVALKTRQALLLALAVSGCIGRAGELVDDVQPTADGGHSIDAGLADAGSVELPDAGLVPIDAGGLGLDAGPERRPLYVAGFNPSGFARSLDGRTWTDLQVAERNDAGVVPGDNAVTDIAFGKGLVVAIGDFGISVSRDGRVWQFVEPTRLHSAVVTFDLARMSRNDVASRSLKPTQVASTS